MNSDRLPDKTNIPLEDPTFRISKMEAANHPPIYARPTDTLLEAVTAMLLHDFSQLPVMQNERTVKGIISWQSIARRQVRGVAGQLVKDFMDEPQIVPYNESLLTVMRRVSSHDCVLVEGSDRRIVGIITVSDLSDSFLHLTKPFLLLSEIERTLRSLTRPLPRELLIEACSWRDSAPDLEKLSFGDYVQLLQSQAAWDALKIPLDRATFTQALEEVRNIRNAVMHFEDDRVTAEAVQKLRNLSRVLREFHVLKN